MIALLLLLAQDDPKGHLVIVGGGKTPKAVLERSLELAGGKSARVVVIPHASSLEDAGKRSSEQWTELGVKDVVVLDPSDPRPLENATLIWMGGGDQNRLLRAIEKSRVPELLRRRYREGAVVGGTSAGAAAMSKVMITGEGDAETIEPEATKTAQGLALWPEAVVDQHFVRRRRFNRLMNVVLDHPQLFGVGIDEATAVMAQGGTFEVLGEGTVVVIDARKAVRSGGGATGILTHVLKPGMKFELK
jgi:cyanophycinase